jgi:hypothetical protein
MSAVVWYEQGGSTIDEEGHDQLAWLTEVTRSDPSFPGTDPFSAIVLRSLQAGDRARVCRGGFLVERPR